MVFNAKSLTYDPYRNFKFLVKWDNEYIAAVSKVSALTKSVEAKPWRAGGLNTTVLQLPMGTKYEPITLERGVSADPAFIAWMNRVNSYQAGGLTGSESFHDFRKDFQIEVYSLTNEKVLVVSIYNAWPSKLIVLPELNANAGEVAIETLELQNEGFTVERLAYAPEER
ncbi:phage tail protein [Nannocystis punicea]|uniref:Phage tail protein n=1 Tax=Nannocystis punicea TaxID=2995304 RepID=A0ABY7H6X0_9BACT|nr:phage tail protein [Nannocystis poenicansa]WAS94825.1 phage tail protein [Nannocystis poenicansa]